LKKLRLYIFSLLIIPVCLLAACGSPAPNEATITMKEMAFAQSEINVKAGQTAPSSQEQRRCLLTV